MTSNAIPTLILSGFLGAGKTTLLRALIPGLESQGLHPTVILNDYQNARVDASSLGGPGRLVTPINGNCVCCDSLSELVSAMTGLQDISGQVLLIEANGTSDPASLLQHLLFRPEIRDRFFPILQVTCIHATRWQKRLWNNDLERLQVRTSSHLVLTHTEDATDSRKLKVTESVNELNPRAAWTTAGDLVSTLHDLVSHRAEHHHHDEDCHHGRCCHGAEHEDSNPCESHDHPGEAEGHVLSHAFVAAQLDLPPHVSRERLLRWVGDLPEEILRVKGVARFAEMPDKDFVFERTDDHKWGPTVLELNQPSTVPPCVVLIGVNLDLPTLQSSISSLEN